MRSSHAAPASASIVLLATARSGAAPAADSVATGDKLGKTIAFRGSYAGNAFRQVMIKAFEETCAEAERDFIQPKLGDKRRNDGVKRTAAAHPSDRKVGEVHGQRTAAVALHRAPSHP